MKTLFLSVIFSSLLAASPCVTASLSVYTAGGFSCNIGDKTFASFFAVLSAVAANGTAGPSNISDITVVPSGGSADPGFSFQGNFIASTTSVLAASSETFTVGYTGFAPATDPFGATSIFLTTPQVSGLGAITASEALCENGSFTSPLNPLLCSAVVVNSALTSNITNANLTATVTLALPPGIIELGVIKQLTLTSGLGGSATASAINNGFAGGGGVGGPVPEPATYLTLLSGLLLLGLYGRKFAAK